MIDMAALTKEHRSAASTRRMARRRAAEFRLKAYGVAAISVAALALAALMYSVIGKAAGALTETYVTLPVELSAEKIDPDATGDPQVIRKAKFNKISRGAVRAAFPGVSDRKRKRQMNGLISAGAQLELRDMVVANPSLVGETIDYCFLASDNIDLYVKGFYGELEEVDTSGVLSPSGAEGEVELVSTSEDFSVQLAGVKAALFDRADRMRAEADRQANGVRVVTARATEATGDAQEKLLAQAAVFEQKRALAQTQAEELEARGSSSGGSEPLSEDLPSILIAVNGGWVRATEVSNNSIKGQVMSALESDAEAPAGAWDLHVMETPQQSRKVSDQQIVWIEQLRGEGRIDTVFNWRFFQSADSRDAELAGVWGAAVGSFWTMLVTFFLSFPVGVLAAIYLEEFAKKNRITDFIEVNINNLAAVPSIVFGLLGLAIFVAGIKFELFGQTMVIGGFLPRSAPLAGGFVLALMTLPTIIIVSRAAIAAVPPSIRDAALGLGASRVQTSFHHVLPLAMPGIMTGAILGMARALGETAPLIMIGMVAFIADVPTGVTSNATVLPVQVYSWSDVPERAFEMRTAAAICVLLLFLIAMNALAVALRKRFERRW